MEKKVVVAKQQQNFQSNGRKGTNLIANGNVLSYSPFPNQQVIEVA